MTTWKPRLCNIPQCLESLRNQTLKADKILFTLSREDFSETPDCLIADDIEIQWIDKNLKVWKKLIVALDLYPNAELINCDDDVLYPKDFIEKLHNKHINTNLPVTVCDSKAYRGIYTHLGCGSLIKSEYFKGYKSTQEVMDNIYASDLWYTFIIYKNNYLYVSCPEAMKGVRHLPSPEPYTKTADINPEWEWLQKHYDCYKL